MPRDAPSSPAAGTQPAWLTPALLNLLAQGIATDLTRGIPYQLAALSATERARALCPAIPMPQLAEAVALALCIAEAPMLDAPRRAT
jgi:hypothetical protein